MIFFLVVSLLAFIFAAIVFRVLYLICHIITTDCYLEKQEATLRTIVCIGSGGHTAEMLRIMNSLQRKYQPRLYIMAHNDVSSEVKIHVIENNVSKYSLSRIPRSRNVNQSYISSVISTLYATLCTIPVVYNFKPDIIFCNGPGTCIPICVVAFILRCFFLLDCRIVFIESVCRVRTLSLSGKILQYFADIIIVQWPQLKDVCFRAKYFGRLT